MTLTIARKRTCLLLGQLLLPNLHDKALPSHHSVREKYSSKSGFDLYLSTSSQPPTATLKNKTMNYKVFRTLKYILTLNIVKIIHGYCRKLRNENKYKEENESNILSL